MVTYRADVVVSDLTTASRFLLSSSLSALSRTPRGWRLSHRVWMSSAESK